MKPVISLLFVIVLVLSTSTELLADLPGPKTPKKDNKTLNTSLEVVPDPKATSARLLIRQSDLNQLRAALEGNAGNQSLAASIANNAPRTIIAGLLLFLSIAVAGILLVRSIRTAGVSRGHKTASIIILVITTLGAAAIVSRGNAGPPLGSRWWDVPAALANGQSASGSVTVEIVADDQNPNTAMKLIIPFKKRSGGGDE
jgi:hypothetical protein